MQRVHMDAFMQDWVGKYVAGETYLYFCQSPTLYGFTLWGWPTEADVASLAHALTVELRDTTLPHVSLVDTRRIAHADPGAFGVLNTYVRNNFELLKRKVQQLALVRPGGLEGAVVAGFFQVLQPPYPVHVVEDVQQGLRSLGIKDVDAVALALDSAHVQVSGVPHVVSALHAVLADRLTDATPAMVARIMGLSQRTLQRRLGEAGTTFVTELNNARIKEAQRRMLATRDPLTNIAMDVGCASLQHFSALFRRLVGDAPSSWRTAHSKNNSRAG